MACMHACMFLRNTPLLTCVTIQNLVVSVKYTNVRYEDPPGKWAYSWSRLSRSFDIIGTHRDRLAACDFLLLICIVTMGLYRFRDNERFWPKIVNLSHVLILTAPLTRFPLEFCNGNWAQKLE